MRARAEPAPAALELEVDQPRRVRRRVVGRADEDAAADEDPAAEQHTARAPVGRDVVLLPAGELEPGGGLERGPRGRRRGHGDELDLVAARELADARGQERHQRVEQLLLLAGGQAEADRAHGRGRLRAA